MVTKSKTPLLKSAKELLSSLTIGKKAEPKKSVASRPELDLDAYPNLKESFLRFMDAWAIDEIVDQRLKQEKGLLNTAFFKIWVEKFWKAKSRPANPSLSIPNDKGQDDLEGLYQVHDKPSLNLPQVPEGRELKDVIIENLAEAFKGTGMPDADAADAAEKFVSEELVLALKPVVDLDRLANGRWEGTGKNKNYVEATATEQEIAAKAITLFQARKIADLSVTALFTDEEMNAAITFLPNVMVKPGFFNRVCSYVTSLAQLQCIFDIVKLTNFVQGKKYAVSDTSQEQNVRKLAAFKDMMG